MVSRLCLLGVAHKQESFTDRCSSYYRVTGRTMSWTLEAGFALAALILTLLSSGLGLVLKYRRGLSRMDSSKLSLIQLLVEGIMVKCTHESIAHAARSRDW